MKIVCFGDSITRGVSFVKGRLRILKENYPAFLQGFFANDSTIDVVNKGVFNDNSNLLLKRIEKDVISEHPDIVIICVGGNDCNFHWDEVAKKPEAEHVPIVPLQIYIKNIKYMVEKFKTSGIKPLLLTLPPLDPVRYYRSIANQYGKSISHWISYVGGIEHWHGLYNRSLSLLIEQLDVLSIDVRTAIKKAGDLKELISDDGIHLTPEGYYVMGKKIYEDLGL
ncbi:GDSL family lipase [Heyndrickxia shackletonii]|uniref:GDSL family lipase n=1 Tax=Heyndrickxia shackletonii TaxID=157838 RepID=A0A0Q3WUM2_9BACI|nr:GDSL-type esterase/lipase family protein [Heyndrickxia shackletonii]KQL55114.1 GDSL family lipase [Heyndrickxia shackletonii]MBB2482394.1 SGNH/GDSL hydrolase family protein [Bacillus sp. APMAM]NEY98829.1 SGNH/GDSL hydrolase family protein [Heyndrickxia shackletonii]RTZ54249.1 SGNH/GDSL hydrolase family protein [Bacillus sp. SAJ1]